MLDISKIGMITSNSCEPLDNYSAQPSYFSDVITKQQRKTFRTFYRSSLSETNRYLYIEVFLKIRHLAYLSEL